MKTKILQIYYEIEQAPKISLEGFFNGLITHLPASPSYLAFESQCMVRAILENRHDNCSHFGMVSWKFLEKMKTSKRWPGLIKNTSSVPFALDAFYKHASKFDICSLTNHPPHSVYALAEQYHPGICQLTQDIVDELRLDVDVRDMSRHGVIYFNYFVAEKSIYEHFVRSWLWPFIEMALSPRFIHRSLGKSNYPMPFPDNLQIAFPGINHYPMLPFMTERLINLYLLKHKLNFSNF